MFKKFILKLHLWLGLISGLFVFLICISGALYVFKEELFVAFHKDKIYVEESSADNLPLSDLWDIAQEELGDAYLLKNVITYKDKGKAWKFKAYKQNPDGITYGDWIEYDQLVYVNPRTGNITGRLNHKYEFFQLVKMFHWSFLLQTKYGQPIVGWSVFIFVILLITGLVLWWPAKMRKKAFKKALTINWRGKKRVLNYDLHNVLGFYSMGLTLILSLTGMVWAFKWFMGLVYVVASGTTVPPEEVNVISEPSKVELVKAPMDEVNQAAWASFPEVYSIRFGAADASSPKATISAFVREDGDVYNKAHYQQYNKYTGELLHSRSYTDMNNGERLIRMNYDIHVGAIWGLGGKLLALLGALIGASLPVTGFYIWWFKRREKRKFAEGFE